MPLHTVFSLLQQIPLAQEPRGVLGGEANPKIPSKIGCQADKDGKHVPHLSIWRGIFFIALVSLLPGGMHLPLVVKDALIVCEF